jgi:hypothetical protein
MNHARWPALTSEHWRETYATLHMWTQIVGKICLALTPLSNHFWNITFQVTARGLATPLIPAGDRTFTVVFDFISHQLLIQTSDGAAETIPLEPRTGCRLLCARHERATPVAHRRTHLDATCRDTQSDSL